MVTFGTTIELFQYLRLPLVPVPQAGGETGLWRPAEGEPSDWLLPVPVLPSDFMFAAAAC